LLTLLEKLGHKDCDPKQTNMSLSRFSGESGEAKCNTPSVNDGH
jgi:hypothetical protein